jgi:hypothetical protein
MALNLYMAYQQGLKLCRNCEECEKVLETSGWSNHRPDLGPDLASLPDWALWRIDSREPGGWIYMANARQKVSLRASSGGG